MAKTLSVCAIVGHESVHIERFLRGFSRIADEIVLVFAQGSRQSTDDSLQIARDFARNQNLPIIIGRYSNHEGERAAWTHVDDFAKARQVSFDLATGDWLMWSDCDDVWPDSQPNRDLVDKLKAGEFENYSTININYDIPNARSMVPRERLAKRLASPTWHNPVHEDMRADGLKLYVEGPSIIHSPLTAKEESCGRNLRILRYAIDHPDEHPEQSSMWFYLHRELMFDGQSDAALKAADKALEYPQGEVEKYELLLNTSRLALEKKDVSDAKARLLGAITAMPWRREAFAGLAQIERDQKNFKKMLGYTMAMRGIDEPLGKERPWTQRDTLYGWHGAFLHHQALRLNGKIEQAEAEEENVFRLEGSTISVIHPTRLRPDLAVGAYSKWMATAMNPGGVQYIFAVDCDDLHTQEILKQYKCVIVPRGTLNASDYAKRFATGRSIIIIGDNWEPVYGWDKNPATIVPPAKSWKIEGEAPTRYPNIIKKTGCRYIICGKESKQTSENFQAQHQHFELGWEVNTSHVWSKYLLSQGKVDESPAIVTLPGREFLYRGVFSRVITWEQFCGETGRKFGTPYQDASNSATLDLVEWFERNWHRYPVEYFSGPDQTWGGGAWDLIQNFERSHPVPPIEHEFLLVSLRKRPHENWRDTGDDFGQELLRGLRNAFGLPIFLVGLNLPDFGVDSVYPISLQEFTTLAQYGGCRGILGSHSGPNGVAGLLSPKGRKIIIFPQQECVSIDANYPTGMGKCLNLNENIRHWMPVKASAADIVSKAKEVL